MKFAAVIVTYNRIKLLKEVLDAFDNQSRKPDYMVVVDNASTDGTDKFLEDWSHTCVDGIEKILVRTDSNIGGSGGFYVGTKRSLDLDVDWVWVSDDDAVPALDVFEKAEKHIKNNSEIENISAICTAVYVNDQICTSNRNKRIMKLTHMELQEIDVNEYKKNIFKCDNFSYVGVLIKKKALQEVGLINKDYFIWRDDVEHSWRVSNAGDIVCYPDMKVYHKVNSVDYTGVSWKTYYGYRNDIIMLISHKKYFYVITKTASALCKAFSSKNSKVRKLYLRSIAGGFRGEKGLNSYYLPGTRIE